MTITQRNKKKKEISGGNRKEHYKMIPPASSLHINVFPFSHLSKMIRRQDEKKTIGQLYKNLEEPEELKIYPLTTKWKHLAEEQLTSEIDNQNYEMIPPTSSVYFNYFIPFRCIRDQRKIS